jgi:uncharacterized RDD family membrane protein YckC
MSTQGIIDSPIKNETSQADVAVQEAQHFVQKDSPLSVHTFYATLWRRFAAYVIDAVIIGFIVGAVTFFVIPATEAQMEAQLHQLLLCGGAWLYFSLCESSRKQATPGKLVLGIKVVGPYGTRISFGRATARFFATALSNLTLGIGYVMAGFTPKKQALHDMISNCFVVKK